MKVKLLHPLISCLCISSNRPESLLKSIISFDQQNYPNKELIVSYAKGDKETKDLISNIVNTVDFEIIAIEHQENESVGLARNNAARVCNGDYICMWDDDDIYYFTRIADQYNLLQGEGRYYQSSMILQIILYDGVNKKAFLSFKNQWNGTLLCKTEHFLKYPCTDSNHYECRPVIDYLLSKNLMLQTRLSPNLYTYVYHGLNVVDYFHFQYYVKKSSPLSTEHAQSINTFLEQRVKVNIS